MSTITTNRIFIFFSLFVFCFILFAARRPEIINNPQFWGEDGAVWYNQAYTYGAFRSLILAQDGYFQTFPKLVASFSLLFPLYAAPLIFNIIAITIRCLVILFLLSSRMERYPLSARLIISLYILIMPNLDEVHANITNTQWYLSLWLFMVLIAEKPKGIYWQINDYMVLILTGLSGPFIVFLSPVLALRLMEGMSLKRLLFKTLLAKVDSFVLIFSIICIIQVAAILMTGGTRSGAPLGASPTLLSSILSTRLLVGFLLSLKAANALWNMHVLNFSICTAGIAILIYCFIKGDWRAKAIVIYPVLMLGFALAMPMIHSTLPQWPFIEYGAGQRYFLVPNIFWVAIILLSASKAGKKAPKAVFTVMTALILIAGWRNFSLTRLPNQNWVNEVFMFEQSQPGDVKKLNTLPPGWTVELIKR